MYFVDWTGICGFASAWEILKGLGQQVGSCADVEEWVVMFANDRKYSYMQQEQLRKYCNLSKDHNEGLQIWSY